MKKLNLIIIFCVFCFKAIWAQNCADQIDYMNTTLPQPPMIMPAMIAGVTYNEVRTIAIPTHMGNSLSCSYTISQLKLDTVNCTGGIILPGYNAQWEMYDDQGNLMELGDTINFDYNVAHKFFCLRLKSNNPPIPLVTPYVARYIAELTVFDNNNCMMPSQSVIPIPIQVQIVNANSNTVNYPVQGYVYMDLDSDCVLDTYEQVMNPGYTLKVVNASTQAVTYQDVFSDGFYHLSVPNGTYHIELITASPTVEASSCAPSMTVQVDNLVSQQLNFPMRHTINCPLVEVSMGGSAQNRCFPNSTLIANYYNMGNQTASGNLAITFPPEVFIKSSSVAPSSIIGNTYIFVEDSLAPNQSKQIHFVDSIDCNAVNNITICPRVEFVPHNACFPVPAQWDGANVDVSGTCTGSQVRFVIKNTGSNGMASTSLYRVYLGASLIVQPTSFQLGAGDSLVLTYSSAYNRTYRLEADQVANHPRESLPRYFVEACGPGPTYFMGNVANIQQDDLEGDVDICCIVTDASYDPNDKQVSPQGETEIHAITRRDELEYMIRFQNTGTGPAYTVRVEDNLDLNHLDLNTLILGAASHHYIFTINENGHAVWTFPQIALPDSASDAAGSIGFLKFKIKQKGILPWGTVINNTAEIYFDSNPAIVTNTTFNTVDSLFKYNTASMDEFAIKSFHIYPNPSSGFVTLDLKDLKISGEINIRIINLNGQTIFSQTKTAVGEIPLDCTSFASGIYYIQISDADHRLYRSKLIKR